MHKKSEIYNLVWGKTPYIPGKKLVLVGKITGLRKVIMNGYYMVRVYTYHMPLRDIIITKMLNILFLILIKYININIQIIIQL